jgi:hypothetical protein
MDDDEQETWDQETQEHSQHSQAADLNWLTNIELFEMLDSQGSGLVSFREFCALAYLVAAGQSNQLLTCLYDHGVLLFDIIGGG